MENREVKSTDTEEIVKELTNFLLCLVCQRKQYQTMDLHLIVGNTVSS